MENFDKILDSAKLRVVELRDNKTRLLCEDLIKTIELLAREVVEIKHKQSNLEDNIDNITYPGNDL